MTAIQAPRARRTPVREAEEPEEEALVAPGWQARARQWLRARSADANARMKEKLRAAAISSIDSGIAALQGLRLHAGGAQPEDERRERDRARPGKRTQTGRAGSETGATDPVAVKHAKRRLRGLLIYLGVMLLGGMAGMALSYDLLAQLLDKQSAELKRHEIKQLKYSKSLARLTARADSALAKQARAEASLSEALAKVDKTLAESEKKLGELEKKRADAETQLAAARDLRMSAVPRLQEGAGSRGAARNSQAAWTTAGDCTLRGDNVRSVLKGCISAMGRK